MVDIKKYLLILIIGIFFVLNGWAMSSSPKTEQPSSNKVIKLEIDTQLNYSQMGIDNWQSVGSFIFNKRLKQVKSTTFSSIEQFKAFYAENVLNLQNTKNKELILTTMANRITHQLDFNQYNLFISYFSLNGPPFDEITYQIKNETKTISFCQYNTSNSTIKAHSIKLEIGFYAIPKDFLISLCK